MRNVTTHASWTLALTIAFSLATTSESHADPIVSNFNQAITNSTYMGSGGVTDYGEEFNVGSRNQTLGSINLLLASTSPYSAFAELLEDNGSNNPATATLVTTFKFPTLPNGGNVYESPTNAEFDPTVQGVTLLANTNYFFMLGYISGTGNIELSLTNSTTVAPGSVGSILGPYESPDYGTNYYYNPPYNLLIEVNPASVPEPASIAMMGIAGGIALVVARVRRKRSVA